jgi:hypothetical protein
MLVLPVLGVSFNAASCFGCAGYETWNAATCSAVDAIGKFKAADVAKIKWIEGTWRGMDGDKPFYEPYKIEERQWSSRR